MPALTEKTLAAPAATFAAQQRSCGEHGVPWFWLALLGTRASLGSDVARAGSVLPTPATHVLAVSFAIRL